MKQNIEQLCDEEIQPVEIDNKIDNEDYTHIKSCLGIISCSLSWVPLSSYGTGKCEIREILSWGMILGIVYLASDAVYDYIQNYNKNKLEEKQ